MARIKLRVKPRDQKPFTRYNANKCSIAEGGKREFGIRLSVQGDVARERKFFGGRTWRVDASGQEVQNTHDSGNRVGSRTVTLTGPPLKTRAEQAQEVRDARAARKQARMARAAERAEAAQKARTQAAERPDPRRQARSRPAERPRSAEDERAARERARTQEAEARERLSASAPRARQPEARQQVRPAPQPRAIEPPRTGLQWLLRNPFAARPEPAPAQRAGRR